MKKLLFFALLLLVGCTKNVPTYHIGDTVIITYGFYTGCQGQLTAHNLSNVYTINYVTCPGGLELSNLVASDSTFQKVIKY